MNEHQPSGLGGRGDAGTRRRGDAETGGPGEQADGGRGARPCAPTGPEPKTQNPKPVSALSTRHDEFARSPTPALSPQSRSATTARNILALRELELLLPSLAGIRVLLLKGIALLPLYPSPGERPLSDVDLLVDPRDVSEVRRRLAETGFRPEPVHSEAYDGEFYREMSFIRPAGEGLFRIDLHWGLVSAEWFPHAGNPGFDEIWSRSLPGPFDSPLVRIPGVEDNLLHICLHLGLHHSFEGDLPYRDIALLAASRDPMPDWDLFLKLVERSGWSPAVYWALAGAHASAGADVPPAVLRALAPVDWRLRLIGMLVASDAGRGQGGPHPADRRVLSPPESFMGQQASRLLQLALVERIRDAASMVRFALLPPDRWLRLRYFVHGDGCTIGLRLLHLLRLLALSGRALAQAIPRALHRCRGGD